MNSALVGAKEEKSLRGLMLDDGGFRSVDRQTDGRTAAGNED